VKIADPLASRVDVGLVIRPHGLRGEVAVEVLSDVPDRFVAGAELQVSGEGGEIETRTLASVRQHGARLLIRFEGIETRDQAEELRGLILQIDRERVPAPPPGFYYHFELVGCRCCDRERGDLGRISDVVSGGGGELLRVQDGRREILIPFVAAFIVALDRQARILHVDLPAGLLEACASTS
jgi:16S rRNA processing protein RimM